MRAAVFHGAGDMRIETVPTPSPREGEVLVRVLRSGLCGTDVTEWTKGPVVVPLARRHPHSGHLGPLIMGHEFVGEVVAGDGLAAGTVVASGAQVACGACVNCSRGRINVCERLYTLGLQADGGHAGFVAAPVRYLVAVPDGLSIDAAALAQPLGVGIHAARRAEAMPGDRVLIIGAGAIGTFILAGLARLLPEVDVTVADIDPARLERSRRLGVATTVDTRSRELPDGFDVVIEASGATGMLGECLRRVRTGGRVLAVGIAAEPQPIDPQRLVVREVTVTSANALVTPDDLPAALDILATGGLAELMLDSVRPLHGVAAALDAMAAGSVTGKILLDPWA